VFFKLIKVLLLVSVSERRTVQQYKNKIIIPYYFVYNVSNVQLSASEHTAALKDL